MKTGRRALHGHRGAETQAKRPFWGVKRKDEKTEPFPSPALPLPIQGETRATQGLGEQARSHFVTPFGSSLLGSVWSVRPARNLRGRSQGLGARAPRSRRGGETWEEEKEAQKEIAGFELTSLKRSLKAVPSCASPGFCLNCGGEWGRLSALDPL